MSTTVKVSVNVRGCVVSGEVVVSHARPTRDDPYAGEHEYIWGDVLDEDGGRTLDFDDWIAEAGVMLARAALERECESAALEQALDKMDDE